MMMIELMYILGHQTMVDKYFEEERINDQKKIYMLKIVEYISSWIVAVVASICVYILVVDEEHLKNVMYNNKLTMNVDICFMKTVIYGMVSILLAYLYRYMYKVWTTKCSNLHSRLEYLMKTKVE